MNLLLYAEAGRQYQTPGNKGMAQRGGNDKDESGRVGPGYVLHARSGRAGRFVRIGVLR